MKTNDFYFELPSELIAQEPPAERGQSRLMVVDRKDRSRRYANVTDICDFIPSGSVMVFNNSRVRKARIYGEAPESSRTFEFLLVHQNTPRRWLAIGKNSRRLKMGRVFHFPDGVKGTIVGAPGPYREIEFNRNIDDNWLDRFGHVPLPPYIQRNDTAVDSQRYQTVYAETIGSVAAPTAGLHFTPEILNALKNHGVRLEFVTLHVGIGTFLPIRTSEIEHHHMHEESYFVSPETAQTVTEATHRGEPIIAVGTTAVRTLESAWNDNQGVLQSGAGSTDLFIYPGYEFRVVKHLFTNFHTPGSSLVVLVSAFAGRDQILDSYADAIERGYRFFSYGDAMLIL